MSLDPRTEYRRRKAEMARRRRRFFGGVLAVCIALLAVFLFKEKIPFLKSSPESSIRVIDVTELGEAPEIPDIDITLSAVGDIIIHLPQIKNAYDPATQSYNFYPSFEKIKDVISSSDFTIGNYEGTLCGTDIYPYSGYPLFNAPDVILDVLKDTGFDMLSTVNNHSLDTRKQGVIRTIEKMDARGIPHVGTYVSKPETRVLFQNVKGINIAFLAYTEYLNGLDTVVSPEDLDVMINKIDEKKIKEDIAIAKERGADLIVAIMHWGDEYLRTHQQKQENWANMLLAEGVDVIFGGHPHVIQDSYLYEYNGKNVFVCYSLGNFISNQRIETELPANTEDGVIVTLNIHKDGETGKTTVEDATFTPTWVNRFTNPTTGKLNHVVLKAEDHMNSEEYSQSTRSRMQRSYRDTLAQISKTIPTNSDK